MAVADPRSILIVDDEEDVRKALRFILEMDGFKVVGESGNGFDAVSDAWRLQPAGIILDYLIPGMDGAAVAARLRGICPESKIVAFSAVLDKQPKWADSFLNKDRIGHITPLLTKLLPA